MKILLTGATGYIGRRLLPILLEEGHHVICAVRDRNRLHLTEYLDQVEIVEVDLLQKIPEHIKCINFDIAYYLVHSMSNRVGNFATQETESAQNFRNWVEYADAKQIIFLTSLIPNTLQLSQHFSSRQAANPIWKTGRDRTTRPKSLVLA
ncbi:NAD(P)H-binding protein [Fibrobacterales bacterium]|nr:NAD(P)H-binding protein [Fibrobacterales bacterium]